ncbi:alpha/beta hydrolase, partial [Methylobacterium sp. WL122]
PASPAMPRSTRAETMTIEGPGGPLDLRVIRPRAGVKLRGAYLHIHRGGWVWGSADEQDPWLERIADTCGFICLSVDYRLAPEHPYPAALLDCEAAALWLAGPGKAEFGVTALTIGGESVGAHLAVMVLLRLRRVRGDDLGVEPLGLRIDRRRVEQGVVDHGAFRLFTRLLGQRGARAEGVGESRAHLGAPGPHCHLVPGSETA